jgi:hypothetical protein
VRVADAWGKQLAEVSFALDMRSPFDPSQWLTYAPFAFAMPYPPDAAVVQIVNAWSGIARGEAAIVPKLLSDAISALPDAAFAGNPAQSRADLLTEIQTVGNQLVAGNGNGARIRLGRDLRPNLAAALLDSYETLSPRQYTKSAVLALLDELIQRIRKRDLLGNDFDGDGRTDPAVYRPATGTWFSLASSTDHSTFDARGWGVLAEGDVPVRGDFDGDGVIDPAVFRPSTGTWFILKSSSHYTDWQWFGWGSATDTLVPADYDGDGTTDAAVYRPSTGEWFIRPSSGAPEWTMVFGGEPGDTPVPGDYDGDTKNDLAIYRPSTGTWFILTSSSQYTDWYYHGWGVQAEGDIPVPGYYDGDWKTDIAVYRPSSGTWFILTSTSNDTDWMWDGWGLPDDQPMPADYDGDGKTDLAVYRPSTGEWWIKPSDGSVPWSVVFGQTGDMPLQGIR